MIRLYALLVGSFLLLVLEEKCTATIHRENSAPESEFRVTRHLRREHNNHNKRRLGNEVVDDLNFSYDNDDSSLNQDVEDAVTGESRELYDRQTDRDLITYEDLNLTMIPIDFHSIPFFNSSTQRDPDGIHLFFWPVNSTEIMLGPCEGDCDSDEDCDEGLYCFKKDITITSVPGCIGFDMSSTDFCTYENSTYIPVDESTGLTSNFNDDDEIIALPKLSPKKLGLCEGDCDSDEDCDEGLYCFIKKKDVLYVPGCDGFDSSRTDYCTYKNATTGLISESVSSTSIELPLLFVYKENPPNISNLPLHLCQGDCDSDDDCVDDLICYTKAFNESSVPGCSGVSITRTDHCIDPNALVAETQMSMSSSGIPTGFGSEDSTFAPSESSSVTSRPSSFASSLVTTDQTLVLTPVPSLQPSFEPQNGFSIKPTSGHTKKPRMPSSSINPTFSPAVILNVENGVSLDSGENSTGEMVPTQPNSRTNITIAIYFDPWPEEVSWKIEGDIEGLLAVNPTDTYFGQDETFDLVSVLPGENYTFTIEDSGKDGIAGIGKLYEVFVTDHPDIVLADGDGVFEKSRKTTFYVPTIGEYPTSAPLKPTFSPAPTIQTVSVFLTIVFDDWQQETSWKITNEENSNIIYAEIPYDTYRSGESVTEEIRLPPGQTYNFIIKDFFNDGMKDGEYLLMSDDGTILFEGNGSFGAFRTHTFTVPNDAA